MSCSVLVNKVRKKSKTGPAVTLQPELRVVSTFEDPTATFSSEDPEHAFFECQIVGHSSSWSTCTSPYNMDSLLDRGFAGTFKVRSVNAYGIEGPESSQAFRKGATLPNGVSLGEVYAMAASSDGTALVAGNFTGAFAEAAPRMIALNADGTVNSIVEAISEPDGYAEVNALAVQDDGKILVGGYFISYAAQDSAPDYLVRLNADGSEDTAFSANAGVGLNSDVSALAVQDDGKILVGGGFSAYAGQASAPDRILRLNANGTVDSTFSANAGAGLNGGVSAFALQPDGKILVGGSFSSYAGQASAPDNLLRLNADGSVDSAFSTNAGAGFNGSVAAIALQSDGKILVIGQFSSYAGQASAPDRILRLNADGTEDSAFSVNAGAGLNSSPFALALQSDGKILVGGLFSSYAGQASAPDRILRLNADGTEDSAFSVNAGAGLDDYPLSFALQDDGKILVSGTFTSYAGQASTPDRILRLNDDGTEDSAFSANAGAGLDGYSTALAVRSDGKIFVGGSFSAYAGQASAPDGLSRLNVDGTEDSGFSANVGAGFDGPVKALALQGDDKILVGGEFNFFANKHYPNKMAILKEDGTLY